MWLLLVEMSNTMFSITTNTRHSFVNPAFIITSLFLLLILFIRVTRGLDMTDEMQYYGEIKGLIESNKLFSNDLFIQQTVYLLFYPFFYLHHLFYGAEGFVFFGRLLMSMLSIGTYLYAYRKFLAFTFPPIIASLTALSLTFAIPYHGVFAPSYNTISQILWIVFTLKFFEWKWNDAISWGIIPIVTAFAHPTSAVMMSLLVITRLLIERRYKQLISLFFIFLGVALILPPVIFYFATPQEYLASLAFSSGYGVGSAFFSRKLYLITLFAIYTMFGICVALENRFVLIGMKFHLPINLSIIGAIFLFLARVVGGAYTVWTVLILSSLSALAYIWALSGISKDDTEFRQRINWLIVMLLGYATTLGMTSGNGIGQATGGFMVGLPFLLGIAINLASSDGLDKQYNVSCIAFVLILFAVHWTCYPYRESVWWKTNQSIQSIPEFRFVTSSQDRVNFMQQMKRDLGNATQGKRTLIVSEFPGLYFVLGSYIETCMLYMHSLTSNSSEKILLDCLGKKKPEVIVDISADNDIAHENSRIKEVMRNLYPQNSLKCTVNNISFSSASGNNNPKQLKYSLCEL